MIRRLLGRMGLSGYIPGANDMGFNSQNNTDAPDAPLGEAHITYLGGAKTAYSSEESAARQELGEAVEGDLVWPGKPTTLGLRNEEPLAYRYNLTITNLPTGHYVILPPNGGTRQPEGGVLLQPGEETVFEVRFPPIAREHLPPQSFHFVLTRFDPRRRDDPGVVVGEDAARWVPLPSGEDFALQANTSELRLRPWRRNAKFLLSLEDRSFLPSVAQLHILRAPTRQALTEHAEQVETISQSLEARTSGKWSCDLPPTQLRTSCWVTVRGAIRAGEHLNAPVQNVSVALPKPIYVRYVPWLRMGRDWVFLGAGLFSLMWLVWGIPTHQAPVVEMKIQFADLSEGAWPKDGNVNDLRFQIDAIDGKPVRAIPGLIRGNDVIFEDLPKRWYGVRWPFNWGSGRMPHNYKVSVSLANPENSDVYTNYSLMRLKEQPRLREKGKERAQPSDPSVFVINDAAPPFMKEWLLKPTAIIPIKKGVRLNVFLEDNPIVKQAAQHGDDVKVVYVMKGVRKEKILTLAQDEKQVVLPDVDLDVKNSGKLKVYMEVGKISSSPWIRDVKLQDDPYKVELVFPPPPKVQAIHGSYKPGELITIPGEGLGEHGEVFLSGTSLPGKPAWASRGVSFMLPMGTAHGSAVITLQPEGSSEPIPAGTITVQDTGSAPGASAHNNTPSVNRMPENKEPSKGNNGAAKPASSELPLSPEKESHLAGWQPGNGHTATPTFPATGTSRETGNTPAPGAGNYPKQAQYVEPFSSKQPAAQSGTNPSLKGNGNKSAAVQSASGKHPTATSSLNANDFSAYELFVMGLLDQASVQADAMLQSRGADANTQASAHAIKGMIYLPQDQSAAEDEIAKAMSLAGNLRSGRGRALAYVAQARLDGRRKVSRDQMMNTYLEARKADNTLAIAYSDAYVYYLAHELNQQADNLYSFGLINGNRTSPLFHFVFARLFAEHGDTAKAQEEVRLMQSSERNAKRRRVLSDLANNSNDS